MINSYLSLIIFLLLDFYHESLCKNEIKENTNRTCSCSEDIWNALNKNNQIQISKKDISKKISDYKRQGHMIFLLNFELTGCGEKSEYYFDGNWTNLLGANTLIINYIENDIISKQKFSNFLKNFYLNK